MINRHYRKLINSRIKKTKSEKGFTLIEVVLVLAIGGLIFLLAFLAFQQVSVNRRDTQRRSDAARIIAELNNFTANGGKIDSFRIESFIRLSKPDSSPADACGSDSDPFIQNFIKVYMCKDGKFKSPSGGNYQVVNGGTPFTSANEFKFLGLSCDLSAGKNAIIMKLEKGEVCREL